MKGFSLLEILFALGIMGAILVLLTSSLSDFRTINYLTESESTIVGILRDARAQTLSSVNKTTYGVYFEETKVVLFTGAAYTESALDNKEYILPPSVRMSTIGLGGTSEIVFARLTGRPSASGPIVISSRKNSAITKTITIGRSGVIQ